MAPHEFQASTLCHETTEGSSEQRYPLYTLKAIHSDSQPYIVTFDSLGAASHVWSAQSGQFTHVTELKPALPGAILAHRASITYCPSMSVLVIGFELPVSLRPDQEDKPAVLRLYPIPKGILLQELELPGRLALGTSPFRCSSFHIAAAVAVPVPQIIVYNAQTSACQEVLRIPASLQSETLLPIYIQDTENDFVLVTSTTNVPSSTLLLRAHTHQGEKSSVKLDRPEDLVDWLRPGHAVKLTENAIALYVTETHSSNDHRLDSATSMICVIAVPDLAISWKKNFDFRINKITSHSSLNSLVVLGEQGQHGDSVSTSVISFLSIQDGSIMRTESFLYQPGVFLSARCTSADELLIVTKTGGLCVTSLKSILDEGFRDKDDEGFVITRPSPLRPDPYNAKARKAGDGWKWVEQCIIYSKGVILLPSRGTEIYAVTW